MSERITLAVGESHAVANTRCAKPIVAIEELVWNSLDADATEVNINLHRNDLDMVDSIEIVDNGTGIDFTQWKSHFGKLGDSHKISQKFTKSKRRMHGKFGKGRLKALGLGELVTWISRYVGEDGELHSYEIKGNKSFIRDFEASAPSACTAETCSGVTVRLENLQSTSLLENAESIVVELVQRFCLYLKQYPGITIRYDGILLDPAANTECQEDYTLRIEFDSKVLDAELSVVEWKKGTGAEIYLCDSGGFAVEELKSKLKRRRGWSFSAYLKSPLIDSLETPAELNDEARALLDHVQTVVSEHFLKRESHRAKELVETWKTQKVYPYAETPVNPVEEVEKNVFDLCALNVSTYIRGFDSTSDENKRLTFRLLKEALTQNPTMLGRILREVASLPTERQEELAEMLERAKLSSIISASHQVLNRLRFLESLDDLLFGSLSKSLNEPRQLHRVLSKELWLFGEQYNLGTDEKGLREVLRKHIEILGRNELVTGDVKLLDGKDARYDLMLWTQLPIRKDYFEHLVVELKRPSIKIGLEEINQIQRYATSVSKDRRFDKLKTNWHFILIGTEFDEYAEDQAISSDRPYGVIKTGNPHITLMKWSVLKQEAIYRYEFFKKELAAELKEDDGLRYLREKHSEHFESDWSAPKKVSAESGTSIGSRKEAIAYPNADN